jgi:hypothetical protein
VTDGGELPISVALERLALALGEAGAVPRGDLIRALERAAERLRSGTVPGQTPTDVVSQAEAARFVGVSRQAVNQWVRKGILRTYPATEGNGRRAPLVSLAEISVAANRWQAEPVSVGFRPQLNSFLDLLRRHDVLAPTADQIATALENRSAPRDEDAAAVLRDFLTMAMETDKGEGQELTDTGVRILAAMRPSVAVGIDTEFGSLLDRLGLLVGSTEGTHGFDTASAALLGLIGAATVGIQSDRPQDGGTGARLGQLIANCGQEVWGENWLGSLFDTAYNADELISPKMTRYPIAMVYLGCNRYMRQAQAHGVSITYAVSPGVIMPQSYYGAPRLAGTMDGHRSQSSPWPLSSASPALLRVLDQSAGNPFRFFNFEYGLFDDSTHGIRRYCFPIQKASEELREVHDQVPAAERTAFLDLAVQTLAHVLEKPYVEVTTVEPPHEFDWWKNHLIRCSPRETLIRSLDEKARKVAPALLVRSSLLPQILSSGHHDPALRERLRVYVKNLDYSFTDERYSDDLARGVTRLVKWGAEDISQDAALERAETEVRSMMLMGGG